MMHLLLLLQHSAVSEVKAVEPKLRHYWNYSSFVKGGVESVSRPKSKPKMWHRPYNMRGDADAAEATVRTSLCLLFQSLLLDGDHRHSHSPAGDQSRRHGSSSIPFHVDSRYII